MGLWMIYTEICSACVHETHYIWFNTSIYIRMDLKMMYKEILSPYFTIKDHSFENNTMQQFTNISVYSKMFRSQSFW